MTTRTLIPVAQEVLSGRITDRVSGHGLGRAKILLSVRSGNGPFVPFPLQPRLRADGFFSLGASWTALTAVLPLDKATRFQLGVEMQGFEPASHVVFANRVDVRRAETTVTVGGQDITRVGLSGAPFDLSVALEPKPVGLTGVVLRDGELSAPIENARIKVAGARNNTTVITGADGRYRLDALPLEQSVEIEARLGPVTFLQTHAVNFKQPLNRLDFSFPSTP